MNRLVYTVFVFFWGSVTTLLVIDWLGDPKRPAGSPNGDLRVFSLPEVAAHDTLDDCWLIVRGEVFDISAFVPEHPSSPRVLESWCGREATEGMETKGRSRPHSEHAWELLERYRIGTVGGK